MEGTEKGIVFEGRKERRRRGERGMEEGVGREDEREESVRERVGAVLNGMQVTRRNGERKLPVCVILSGVAGGRERGREGGEAG